MMNRHERPATDYEKSLLTVRFMLDAHSTGQTENSMRTIVVLDAALRGTLEDAPAPELDRL
jgi:hypothetical protein